MDFLRNIQASLLLGGVMFVYLIAEWVLFKMDKSDNMPVTNKVSQFFAVFLFVFPSGLYYYLKCYPSTIELAHQMLELNSGFNIKKWDDVASKTNFIFHERNSWNTPFFFFFFFIVVGCNRDFR